MNMRYLGIVAAVAVCLALAGPAAAVNYTVAGWGPTSYPGPVTPPAGSPHVLDGLGYPGDKVELQTYTGTLNLTPGTYKQKINTLLWSVYFTYAGTETQWDYPAHWSNLSFDVNAPRTMTIDGACVRSLNQAGLLLVTYNYDRLGFSQGSTTTFQVGTYRVDVTPLVLKPLDAGGTVGPPWVQTPRDMEAQFVVTEVPIPEPVTMAGVMLGIGSVVTYVRKRRTA